MNPRLRIRSQRNADKDMGKAGFHQGVPDTHELKIDCRQTRSHLRSRENFNDIHPDGMREHLDEFFCPLF